PAKAGPVRAVPSRDVVRTHDPPGGRKQAPDNHRAVRQRGERIHRVVHASCRTEGAPLRAVPAGDPTRRAAARVGESSPGYEVSVGQHRECTHVVVEAEARPKLPPGGSVPPGHVVSVLTARVLNDPPAIKLPLGGPYLYYRLPPPKCSSRYRATYSTI